MSELDQYQDVTDIQRVLHTAKTIAIVGLSNNPLRASYFVGYYLQRHGYRVIPVNPRESEILGETSYPSLRDVPEPIDVVNVFRAPSAHFTRPVLSLFVTWRAPYAPLRHGIKF